MPCIATTRSLGSDQLLNSHSIAHCNLQIAYSLQPSRVQGRRHGGDWGEQSPSLLTKAIFINRLYKPMRKYWGFGGGDVINHTWISAWVCHKWFSETGSNLYFIQLLTNFILLNLFKLFVAIRFIRHIVEPIKFARLLLQVIHHLFN